MSDEVKRRFFLSFCLSPYIISQDWCGFRWPPEQPIAPEPKPTHSHIHYQHVSISHPCHERHLLAQLSATLILGNLFAKTLTAGLFYKRRALSERASLTFCSSAGQLMPLRDPY